MSDGESPTPGPRRRPTYGLPGPASDGSAGPGPDGDPYGSPTGAPQAQGPAHGLYDQPYSGSYQQPGSEGYGHQSPAGYGQAPPAGYGPPAGSAPPGPGGQVPGQPRKRRGKIPLIIGLVLLLVIAPVTFIGGIWLSLGSLIGDTADGPTVIEGGSGEVELAANEMLIIYVPSEDADAAQCSAEAAGSGDVSTVPTSGSTQFPDGTSYEQSLGAVALSDTTVTISCEGTDAPAYMGPYNVFGMAGPLLIGPIIGVVSGLIGLVLVIVGIVLMLRSRSS